MGIDDQLRGGTVTRQQLEELAGRVQALEQNATGDGAAFPAQYQITKQGEVTINESTVINELVGEEGGLIVGGPGGKAKTLKPGKPGEVLTINPEGLLEWAAAGGGGTSAHGHAEFEASGEFLGVKIIKLAFEPTDVFVQLGVINSPEEPTGEGSQDTFVEILEGTESFRVYSKAPTSNWVTPFFWLAFG